MKTKLKVTGDKELLAQFRKLQGDIKAGALGRAAEAGMMPIQNAAAIKAPYKTGTLRRSIHTELIVQRALYAEAAAGTDVEYAARIEFGFNDTDALGRTYHQAAQPYLRPAYEENRAAALEAVIDTLRDIVTRFT